MEAQDPLSELADIHLPGELGLWPPAIGWWLLAVAIIIAIIYLARAYLMHLIRLKKLSFALKELDQAFQHFSEQEIFDNTRNQAGLTYLNEVNAILRRVSLLLFPNNSSIAKLNGSAWLAFLDDKDKSHSFSDGPGKALAEGIYQRRFNADAQALYTLAQQWIKARYKEQSAKAIKNSKPSNSKGATP